MPDLWKEHQYVAVEMLDGTLEKACVCQLEKVDDLIGGRVAGELPPREEECPFNV